MSRLYYRSTSKAQAELVYCLAVEARKVTVRIGKDKYWRNSYYTYADFVRSVNTGRLTQIPESQVEAR